MKTVKISNSLFCEDVREEKSGKQILVGVYLSFIGISQFPSTIHLVLWVQFIPSSVGLYDTQMRIIDKNDKVLVTGNMKFEINEIADTVFHLPAAPVKLEQPGSIRWQWRFENGEWFTVKEMEVRDTSRKSSIASQQPPLQSPPASKP